MSVLARLRKICEKAEKTWDVLRLTPHEVLSLLDALEECRETLSWYGSKENWMRSWVIDAQDNSIKGSNWNDKLKHKDCAFLNCGGGRARLTLKTIEEKLQGLEAPTGQ